MSQESELIIKDVKKFFDQGVHDMKNFLSTLELWLNSANQQGKIERSQTILREFRRTYLTKIEKIQEAFNEYLSVSTEYSHSTKIDSLRAWIKEYLRSYRAKHGVEVRLIRLTDNTTSLTYPVSYFKSIMDSLLDNAVMYHSPQQELTVEVSLTAENDGIKLQVKDNGIGIDLEQNQSRLFQPFQRFTSQGEGQGLSLHLVKTMVERNGGNIAIESAPGKGTTVSVLLKDYK